MANKISQTKSKRLSKSQRTHVRRLKQAAGKTGAAPPQPTRCARVHRQRPSRKTDAARTILTRTSPVFGTPAAPGPR